MIDHAAVLAELDEAIETAQEPAVVGDCNHRPPELGQPGFECFCRNEIEVVRRLVEQQHRRADEFEQQDLEPRLLASAQCVEGLLGATLQLVAAEHAHRRPAHDIVAMQDVEQPQEVALAGAVRTEDRDAFAVPDLGRERVGEAVQFELLDGQGALAGALTAEVDVDPLLADLCRLVVLLVELAEPALGSLQSRREHLADLGPSAHLGHELFELAALLFVDGQVVLASGEVGVAGVVIKPATTLKTKPAAKPTSTTVKAKVTTTSAQPSTTPAAPQVSCSRAEVVQIIRDIWPDDLENQAIMIAARESNLMPGVRNSCCLGLFQIHFSANQRSLASWGITSPNMLFDPRSNAYAAYALYLRAGGWGPWGM